MVHTIKKEHAPSFIKQLSKLHFIVLALIAITSLISCKELLYPIFHTRSIFISLITLIGLFFCLATYASVGKMHIKLNYIDLIILMQFLYSLSRVIVSKTDTLFNPKLFEGLIYLLLYIYLRIIFKNTQMIQATSFFFIFVAVAHIIIGVIKLFKTYHLPGVYIDFGTFNNVATYGATVGALGIFALSVALHQRNPYIKYTLLSLHLTLVVVIILSGSRASLVATILSSALTLNFKYRILSKIYRYKVLALLFIIIVPIIIGFGAVKLYNLKPDSAYGRWHIWSISMSAIADKPFIGFGLDTYKSTYNTYQASYFDHNHVDKRLNIASYGLFAFNDYIQITVENGILGLLILVSIISVTHKSFILNYKSSPPYLFGSYFSMLYILIIALFSYPMQRTSPMILLITFIAILSTHFRNKKSITFKGIQKNISLVISSLIIICLISYVYSDYNAKIVWKNAHNAMKAGNKKSSMELYEKIHHRLKHDKFFLYNYGTTLSNLGLYNKSIGILKNVEHTINDPDLYIYQGNNYEYTGKVEEASECYKMASSIMPRLMYPKYRLAKMYYNQNNFTQAKPLFDEIINMKVKVESERVLKMRKEIQELNLLIKKEKEPS